MSAPLVGQMQPFGFNWEPRGWIICSGQTLPISQFTALYSLIGDRFGGDGRVTFGIPDLRGRNCIGSGGGPATSNYPWGAGGGAETVTLANSNLPLHSHPLASTGPPPIDATTEVVASSLTSTATVKANGSAGTGYSPVNQYYGARSGENVYSLSNDTTMANDMLTVTTTLDSLTLSTTGVVDLTGVSTGDTGQGVPFDIQDPFTAIGCYAIANEGLYPPRN